MSPNTETDRTAALTEALEEAVGCRDHEERLATIGRLLCEHLGADRCIIGRVEPDAVVAIGGVGLGIAGIPHLARLPLDRGIVSRTALEVRTQLIDDVVADPDYYAASALTRSELAVPVVRSGRAVAVLNLEANRVAAFADEEARILEAVAAYFAWRPHLLLQP